MHHNPLGNNDGSQPNSKESSVDRDKVNLERATNNKEKETHILRAYENTKDTELQAEVHCCNTPLTILANGSSNTRGGAGGHVYFGSVPHHHEPFEDSAVLTKEIRATIQHLTKTATTEIKDKHTSG